MEVDYSVIGSRIKKARQDKNLSQQTLSELIDVSVAFLSNIERGVSHINLKRLIEICGILEVPEGYIISGCCEEQSNYLNQDFSELLDQCSPKQQKMIYNVIKAIIEGS